MDESHEEFGITFLEAEIAIRESMFLKGVELGKGKPLTSDEEQELLRGAYERAYEESLQRSREELLQLKKCIERYDKE